MVITIRVGTKTLEDRYDPYMEDGDENRIEYYVFDAYLQIELEKTYRKYDALFDVEKSDDSNRMEVYRFKMSEVSNEDLKEIQERIKNFFILLSIIPEYISCMKDNLEQLFKSYKEAKEWYNSLEEEEKEQFDKFRNQMISFIEKVDTLLKEKNSLSAAKKNWKAEIDEFSYIPNVNIERLNEIVEKIQDIVINDEIDKNGKENNRTRKNSIRNQLRRIPSIFKNDISTYAKAIKNAQKVTDNKITKTQVLKMIIDVRHFEEKQEDIKNIYQEKMNGSATCPYTLDILEDDQIYQQLIDQLDRNIREWTKNKKEIYFKKDKCVALFDLNKVTRLFSISGIADFNNTFEKWLPAQKVYNILCQDVTHKYQWCRLTPNVKRYLHIKSKKKDVLITEKLSSGASWEMLKDLITGDVVPKEIGLDFSCCERKIFAYFEDDLSKCESNPLMITRWKCCELCIPAVEELARNGINIKCICIWKSREEYYECLENI